MYDNAASIPRVAIIGSGFGGLGMGYYLKRFGIESFTIFEKSGELGGVWRENTYPGAGCDVPSHLYSFSFEPHYPWSSRYGQQPEILAYQRHVARKHDLLRHIRFGSEVTGADFDARRGLWVVRFRDGSTHEARVLVSAVGQLHRPQIPDIPGRERFLGRAFHSARWDHDYDFNGKTVAVIGTGASAVQFVPRIASQVQQLYVYQRSPGWCIPKFDKPFAGWQRRLLDRLPLLHDLDRWRIFWLFEFVASAMVDSRILKRAATLYLKGISRLQLWWQVKDPVLRRKLTPDFPVGCKRTLVSNDWLPALARANVEVVTEGIREITPSGVVSVEGRERKVDAIVWATGFAATEFLAPMELRGLDGQSLHERWQKGAKAYLGVTVSGFPNLFILYGPNTNCGVCSIIYMLERQARYAVKGICELRARGLSYLDVKPEVEAAFNDELSRRSRRTAYESGCRSWYIDAGGRNTNNWVGHTSEYGRLLRRFGPEDYRLVPLSRAGNPVPTAPWSGGTPG
jgi:cation diffusion facilitator CzcD-associated flavoprotein CzcO